MEEHIIPECYFDTVLVKAILNRKRINHQKSCSKVESTVREIDDFALGIIDKDKKEIAYLKEFIEEISTGHLKLWKHREKKHYFIQVIPAIEKFVLNAIEEAQIETEDLNLPLELEALKRYTKYKLVNESEDIKTLCKRLVNSNSNSMKTFSYWLTYLLEHNRNADINILKENV